MNFKTQTTTEPTTVLRLLTKEPATLLRLATLSLNIIGQPATKEKLLYSKELLMRTVMVIGTIVVMLTLIKQKAEERFQEIPTAKTHHKRPLPPHDDWDYDRCNWINVA